MKLLMIGDIVGNPGVRLVSNRLEKLKETFNIDICIANGENSSVDGRGITEEAYKVLINSGVDIITLGNHIFSNKSDKDVLKNKASLVIPANSEKEESGDGYTILDIKGIKVCVISLLGRAYTSNASCPFKKAEELLGKIGGKCNIIIIDFHAETTSEKAALAWYLDGRVSAILGTHTHVQTADERILPQGTGFISDVGMTGSRESIIGIKKEIIIKRFLYDAKDKFVVAKGEAQFNSVILEINNINGKTTKINRFIF
jgi:metallophosphoesterase (TIGR00282 family)